MTFHSLAGHATANRTALPDGNPGGRMGHPLLTDKKFLCGRPPSGRIIARNQRALGESEPDIKADARAFPRQQEEPAGCINRADTDRDTAAIDELKKIFMASVVWRTDWNIEKKYSAVAWLPRIPSLDAATT
jgi:hypothetical protein